MRRGGRCPVEARAEIGRARNPHSVNRRDVRFRRSVVGRSLAAVRRRFLQPVVARRDRRNRDHPSARVRLRQQAAFRSRNLERLHRRLVGAAQHEQLELQRCRRPAPVLHHDPEESVRPLIRIGQHLPRVQRVDRLPQRARRHHRARLVDQVQVVIVYRPTPRFVPVQADQDSRPLGQPEAVDRVARRPVVQHPRRGQARQREGGAAREPPRPVRLRPVPRRRDVGPQRPIRIGQRRFRVARHVALLVVGVEEAHIVDDHIDPLGKMPHRRDHVEIGRDRAEGDLRARREVMHQLDHRRALGTALQPARAEPHRLYQRWRVAPLLRRRQTADAVRNHRHPHARAVDPETLPRRLCAQRRVALRDRRSARVDRVARRGHLPYPSRAAQRLQLRRGDPALRAPEIRKRQLRLEAERPQRRQVRQARAALRDPQFNVYPLVGRRRLVGQRPDRATRPRRRRERRRYSEQNQAHPDCPG